MTDRPVSDAPGASRELRRARERERRARARRRGRARLAAVLLLALAVAVAVTSIGGGAPRVLAGPTRTIVSVRTAAAGRLPAAVQDTAVAVNGSGSVLLLGGIDAASHSTAAIVALSGGHASVRAQLPDIQHDAQAATLGGQVYVFGGGDVASYTHILRYDPASGSVSTAGQLPQPQSDVAVTTIGRTAYIVGGYNGTAPLDTIVAWRPGGTPRVVAHLPFGVRYASVAAVGGTLIIAGGTAADGVSGAIWSFHPNDRADRAVVQIGVLPDPVTHASAVAVGGRIYLVGGRRSSTGAQTSDIVEIDPLSAAASVVGHLPQALSDAAVVAVAGRILVAGGQGSDGTPRSGVLSVTPVVRTVAARVASAAAVHRHAFALLKSLGFSSALAGHPSSLAAYEAAAVRPGLPGYLLIADRGNNRILVVNPQGQIVWRYPTSADLAAGRILHFNDDTFVAPGGKSLIANEEDYGAVVSVNIKSHKLTLLYGTPGTLGGGPNELNYPDDAYAFADGSWTVADAYNCRILFVRNHVIYRQYGSGAHCTHNPPTSFGAVNGDTPTPYGGILVSEIPGHWIDAINADGSLRWSVQAPIAYPSDPQPLPGDHVLLADYSSPGHAIVMDSHGAVSWRYGPTSGQGQLNHPSLAVQLPNGDVAINDDYRDRVVVVDPHTGKIVWQYGHTDTPGTSSGYLHTPDGMDFIPMGPKGQIDWAAVVHP